MEDKPARSVRELQLLLDQARPGSTVALPAGRFSGTLVVSRPVVLKGDATILDGDLAGSALVVQHDEGEVRVEGLTITGGRGNMGAGVLMVNGGNLVLSKVQVVGNQARGRGGGLYVSEGRLTLLSCVFRANQAPLGGGLFAGDLAQVEAIGCRFDENSADEGGGAFFHEQGGGTLKKVNFTGNQAVKSGGHLFLIGTTDHSQPHLILDGCTFGPLGEGSSGLAVDNSGTHAAVLELKDTQLPE